MLPFSSFAFGPGSCEFFFLFESMSVKPWAVPELRLNSQKLRTFRRNLLGADNETWSRWRFFENVSTKHLHAHRTAASQR